MAGKGVVAGVRQTAVVVGGAGGIGGAVCRHLADTGYRIALLDRDLDRAKMVIESLPHGDHAIGHVDIVDETIVGEAFDRVEAEGRASRLVVIAGGPLGTPGIPPTLVNTSLDEFQRTLALNATGTFLCVRKFAALRTASPLPDTRIVLFTSITGQMGGTLTGPAYATSKAAVIGFTRHVAFELAPLGITVNAVAPGAVGTEEFKRFVDENTESSLRQRIPLGRICTPEEVATTVGFLVSGQASYVTGITLDVNGGALMR